MDELKKVSLPKEIPKEVLDLFSPSFAYIYSVMPIGFVTEKKDKGGKLEGKYSPPAIEVAFGEEARGRGNLEGTIGDIQFMIDRKIIPVYAPQQEIDAAIAKYYGINRDEGILQLAGDVRKKL